METLNIERQESIGGYKQRIIDALNSRNIDGLIEALKDTNMALTGLELGHFTESGIDELREQVIIFFQQAEGDGRADLIVYLGDSGLSRIALHAAGGRSTVELTNNSTKQVKDKWEKLQ